MRLPRRSCRRSTKESWSRRCSYPKAPRSRRRCGRWPRSRARAPALGARGIYSPRRRRNRRGSPRRRRASGSSATAQLFVRCRRDETRRRFADRLRAARAGPGAGRARARSRGPVGIRQSLIGRRGAAGPRRGAARPRSTSRSAGPIRRARCLRGIKTLADVRDAYGGTQPVIEVTLERDRLAQRGIIGDRRGKRALGGLGGVAASELRETHRRTPIAVRFAGNANEDLTAALATPVGGRAGRPARELQGDACADRGGARRANDPCPSSRG